MKHLYSTISTLLVVFIAVNFSSCDNEPDYEYRTGQIEILKYLTSNYQLGDTLIFVRDSCNNDSFYVKVNRSGAAEHRYNDYQKGHTMHDTLYVKSILEIYSKEFAVKVQIMQKEDSVMGAIEITPYDHNPEDNTNQDVTPAEFIYLSSRVFPVEFTITNSLGHSAHLRKGEGVVDFSDGEHTWVLKNNNDSIGNSVHLRKGEAIIDFSTDEHTWTKKRKIET